MDITKWPLHKKMALPDWCFGQQWWIGTYIGTSAAVPTLFFIEEFPPDIFVLWDVIISPGGVTAATRLDVSLVLCDKEPKADDVKKLTPLLRHFGDPNSTFQIKLPPNVITHIGPMKVIVEAYNNGVGGYFKLFGETEDCESSIALLISSIPKEVPDWVCLGLAGMR